MAEGRPDDAGPRGRWVAVAVVALLVVPGLGAVAQPSADISRLTTPGITEPCPPPYYALLVIGNIETPGSAFHNQFQKIIASAKAAFQKAGFSLVVLEDTTPGEIQRYLAHPCVRAFWFGGHGHEDGRPMLALHHAGHANFTRDRFIATSIKQTFPNIEQVTFAACEQDHAAWKRLFPTAVGNGTFHAWDYQVRIWRLRMWNWWHDYHAPKGLPAIPGGQVTPGGPGSGIIPAGAPVTPSPSPAPAPSPAPSPAPTPAPPPASPPAPPAAPPPAPTVVPALPADIAPLTGESQCALDSPLDEPLAGASPALAALDIGARFAELDALAEDEPEAAAGFAAMVALDAVKRAEGKPGALRAARVFNEAAATFARDPDAAFDGFAVAAYLADLALGGRGLADAEPGFLDFAEPYLLLDRDLAVGPGAGAAVLALRLRSVAEGAPRPTLTIDDVQLPGEDVLIPLGDAEVPAVRFQVPPAVRELRAATQEFNDALLQMAPGVSETIRLHWQAAPPLSPAEAFLEQLRRQAPAYNDLIDEGKIPGGIQGLLAPRMLLEADLDYGGKVRADLRLDGRRHVVDLSLREVLEPGATSWTVPAPEAPQVLVRTSQATIRAILDAEDKGAAALNALETDAIHVEGLDLGSGFTLGLGTTLARAMAKFRPDPWAIAPGERREVSWHGLDYTLQRSPLGYRTLLPLGPGPDSGTIPVLGPLGQPLGFTTPGAQRLGAVPVRSAYGLSPHAGLHAGALGAPSPGAAFMLGGGM